MCYDENLRRKIDRAININEVCDVNPFGVIATIAAYNEGEEWLSQLIDYLWQNYLYMKDFCGKYLPDFPITLLEGTYLVWMDCRKLGKSSEELEHLLIEKAKHGSMPERCMEQKAKASCVGISLVHVPR